MEGRWAVLWINIQERHFARIKKGDQGTMVNRVNQEIMGHILGSMGLP